MLVNTTFRNARLVLPDAVSDGDLSIADGAITAVGEASGGTEIDLEGDLLLPGLIDLHTDNMEHHFQPRPGVRWPSTQSAVLAHDWQMLGAGVTTVLDALSLGDYDSGGARTAMLDAAITGLTEARDAGLVKANHYLHFRCELSDPALLGIVERHIDNPALRLLSVMDHTPGQRQWHNTQLYREFRRKKNSQVWTDEEFDAYLAERRADQTTYVVPGRAAIGALGRARNLRIASHDDTSIADVEESYSDGIAISEFPTTLVAAQRARELKMQIVMGAPNVCSAARTRAMPAPLVSPTPGCSTCSPPTMCRRACCTRRSSSPVAACRSTRRSPRSLPTPPMPSAWPIAAGWHRASGPICCGCGWSAISR